jgi:hypothetical protein
MQRIQKINNSCRSIYRDYSTAKLSKVTFIGFNGKEMGVRRVYSTGRLGKIQLKVQNQRKRLNELNNQIFMY